MGKKGSGIWADLFYKDEMGRARYVFFWLLLWPSGTGYGKSGTEKRMGKRQKARDVACGKLECEWTGFRHSIQHFLSNL